MWPAANDVHCFHSGLMIFLKSFCILFFFSLIRVHGFLSVMKKCNILFEQNQRLKPKLIKIYDTKNWKLTYELATHLICIKLHDLSKHRPVFESVHSLVISLSHTHFVPYVRTFLVSICLSELKCKERELQMSLVLPMSFLENLHVSDLQLNDPACPVFHNTTHVTTTFSLTGCGTKKMVGNVLTW